MTERTRLTRTEISWILYDVANSAFIMLVSTTIPIYFATLVAEAGMDTTTASGLWGLPSLSWRCSPPSWGRWPTTRG